MGGINSFATCLFSFLSLFTWWQCHVDNIFHIFLKSLFNWLNLDSIFSNSKPAIFVIEKLGDEGLDLLKSFTNIDCFYNLSLDNMCSKITMCDALIVRSCTKVNHRVIEVVKGRLNVVARGDVYIDNVDLQVFMEFGCWNPKRKMIGKYLPVVRPSPAKNTRYPNCPPDFFG